MPAPNQPHLDKCFAKFSEMGEAAVRYDLLRAALHSSEAYAAEVWFESEARRRDFEAAMARDKRELEILEEAREANSISKTANSLSAAANKLAEDSKSIASTANSLASTANSAAEEANRFASRANLIAITASIIAAISAVAAIVMAIRSK